MPYRRVVWTQKGMKRPVWRCVNRLDYRKTRCKRSPTLDEKPLRQAVLAAVNSLMSRKDILLNDVASEMTQELAPVPGEVLSLGDIERASGNLARRFDHLMRGQVFTLEEHTFFTMGGASSHDVKDGILNPAAPDYYERLLRLLGEDRKQYRIMGQSWWPEELPSEEESRPGETWTPIAGR